MALETQEAPFAPMAVQRQSVFARRFMLVGLAALILFVCFQYTVKASEDRSAFVRWRPQLHALTHGENIYERYLYPNAPVMALLLYPLACLPGFTVLGFEIDVGALAWFFIKVVLAGMAFVWWVRIVQEKARPFPIWAQGPTLLLSIRPMVGDLTHGNVNLLILFLVVAALYAFKRRRDGIAGLLLALAITCKVTPALFLPYFLWKRAWKVLAATLFGLALYLLIIPAVFFGPSRNRELLTSWIDKMILPYVVHGHVVTEHTNQSLPGLIYRLGTESPSFLDSEDRPADYHNLLSLHPQVARRVVTAFGITFLLLLCLVCRAGIDQRDNWRLAAEYSVVALGMLLFSERTWKHHCVTMLLPFGVTCYCLAVLPMSRRWRYGLIGTLALALVLMASTSAGLWDVFGHRLGAKLAQVYGGYVWAELVLLGCLCGILIKHRSISS